jgi:hypothetical protein
MKRRILLFLLLAMLTLGATAGTFAAQPANPGCFGQDRAAGVESIRNAANAPGASEWGQIAASRGGTNGDQNQAYKTSCGG